MFFLFDFTSWRLTEEDHCFRHVKCKLVCVFMVTVTFSLWMNNKKKIISLYLLIYCCFSVVFCSECDVVIVCTKKKTKTSFQIMTKDIKAVSYFWSQVCCHLHIGLKARNSTICTQKSFTDVVWLRRIFFTKEFNLYPNYDHSTLKFLSLMQGHLKIVWKLLANLLARPLT